MHSSSKPDNQIYPLCLKAHYHNQAKQFASMILLASNCYIHIARRYVLIYICALIEYYDSAEQETDRVWAVEAVLDLQVAFRLHETTSFALKYFDPNRDRAPRTPSGHPKSTPERTPRH